MFSCICDGPDDTFLLIVAAALAHHAELCASVVYIKYTDLHLLYIYIVSQNSLEHYKSNAHNLLQEWTGIQIAVDENSMLIS